LVSPGLSFNLIVFEPCNQTVPTISQKDRAKEEYHDYYKYNIFSRRDAKIGGAESLTASE
jgi:hypothetical protein